MKMKSFFLAVLAIYGVSVTGLKQGFAQTQGGAPGKKRSIHAPETIGESIERIIIQYKKLQKELKKETEKELGIESSDQVHADTTKTEIDIQPYIQVQLKQNKIDRQMAIVSQKVADLRNGGTFAEKLVGLSSDIADEKEPTYHQILAQLYANYYEHPEDRDAIVAILEEIRDHLGAQYFVRNKHEVLQAAMDGAMYTWSFLTLLEWRGGRAGIKKDLKSLYRGAGKGWNWLTTSLTKKAAEVEKAAPDVAAAATSQKWKWYLPSLSEMFAWSKRSGKSVIADARKGPQQLIKYAGDIWENKATVSRSMLDRARNYMVKSGFWVIGGGSAYALYTLNGQSETMKIHPIEGLELFQGFAIVDFETRTQEFAATLSKDFSPSLLDTLYGRFVQGDQTLLKKIQEKQAQLGLLQEELAHFTQHGKRYAAEIPYTSLVARTKKEDPIYKLAEKYKNFSTELIASRKEKPSEELIVSLDPVEGLLDESGRFLTQIAERCEGFLKLSKADQDKIRKMKAVK